MRPGVRFALDVGKVRVGVARSDGAGVLTLPVTTLRRSHDGAELAALRRLVAEHEAIEIIVGLPRSLSGGEGPAAEMARSYARRIARRSKVPVRMVDERLTTVTAHQMLHEAGRAEKTHRAVVDQVAATVILQTALDEENRTGAPPGELVDVKETP